MDSFEVPTFDLQNFDLVDSLSFFPMFLLDAFVYRFCHCPTYLYSSSKQHCFKDCHPLKCTGVILTIIFSHFLLHLYVLIHKMMGSPKILKCISHNSCLINTQYPPCDHSSFKISYFCANKLWYICSWKLLQWEICPRSFVWLCG